MEWFGIIYVEPFFFVVNFEQVSLNGISTKGFYFWYKSGQSNNRWLELINAIFILSFFSFH